MTPVVIMAGGRGLRLDPLTEKYPKPMVGLGGKPLLEQIMSGFARQGFKKFYLCVNYKADLITGYFGTGSKWGWKIRYVHETEPLGTAGALALLPAMEVPFIVSNADVVTLDLKFGALMESHARSNAAATVCLAVHQTQIPYGVAKFDANGEFCGLDEKPIETRMVNAGIYVLAPRVLVLGWGGGPALPMDMPDLIDESVLGRLNAYPIEGYWHHVSHIEDLGWANTHWAHSERAA